MLSRGAAWGAVGCWSQNKVQTLRENQNRGRGRPSDGFLDDMQQATGLSRRTIQLDLERGEKIPPDVLDMLRRTPLDRGTYLDELKNLSHDEQRSRVRHDLEHGRPRRAKSNLTPLQKAWLDACEDERADFLRWTEGTE